MKNQANPRFYRSKLEIPSPHWMANEYHTVHTNTQTHSHQTDTYTHTVKLVKERHQTYLTHERAREVSTHNYWRIFPTHPQQKTHPRQSESESSAQTRHRAEVRQTGRESSIRWSSSTQLVVPGSFDLLKPLLRWTEPPDSRLQQQGVGDTVCPFVTGVHSISSAWNSGPWTVFSITSARKLTHTHQNKHCPIFLSTTNRPSWKETSHPNSHHNPSRAPFFNFFDHHPLNCTHHLSNHLGPAGEAV